MLLIEKEMIENLYSMEMAIEAAERAIKSDADIPLRINFDMPEKNGQVLYMPAYIKGEGITGLKVVSVFPDNVSKGLPVVPAQMILINPDTGELMSIIDGTYLTQIRTAAIQGLATKLLSREDSKVGLIIGTGGQAIFQIEAMLTVRSLDKLYIYNRKVEKAEKFIGDVKEKLSRFDTEFVAVTDLDSAVSEADIITTVTTAKMPTFKGELTKPGVHVNGVGSYTKEMIEVPASFIEKTKKVFMDSENGVLSEAGDVLNAIEKNVLSKTDCFELREILDGKVEGRNSDSEYTFFKTVGTAVLDLVTAWDIYNKVVEKQLKFF